MRPLKPFNEITLSEHASASGMYLPVTVESRKRGPQIGRRGPKSVIDQRHKHACGAIYCDVCLQENTRRLGDNLQSYPAVNFTSCKKLDLGSRLEKMNLSEARQLCAISCDMHVNLGRSMMVNLQCRAEQCSVNILITRRCVRFAHCT